MKKSTRNQNTPVLEDMVNDNARQHAESLGVPLETFVSNLAMKSETLPVTVRVRMNDIHRINSLIGGGRVHQWIEETVQHALENGDGGVR